MNGMPWIPFNSEWSIVRRRCRFYSAPIAVINSLPSGIFTEY